MLGLPGEGPGDARKRLRCAGRLSDASARRDTGVREKNTPPDWRTLGRTSLKNTKSGAGEQSRLPLCGAKARAKGLFFSQTPVATTAGAGGSAGILPRDKRRASDSPPSRSLCLSVSRSTLSLSLSLSLCPSICLSASLLLASDASPWICAVRGPSG